MRAHALSRCGQSSLLLLSLALFTLSALLVTSMREASGCIPSFAQAQPLPQGDVIARGVLGYGESWLLGAQGRLGLSDRGELQLSLGACQPGELWGVGASMGIQYELLERAMLADLFSLSGGIDSLLFYGDEIDDEGGEAESLSMQGLRGKILIGDRWQIAEQRWLRVSLSLGALAFFEDEQRDARGGRSSISRSELLFSPSIALISGVDLTDRLPLDLELRYERGLVAMSLGAGFRF